MAKLYLFVPLLIICDTDVVMLDIVSRSWNPITLAPTKEGAVLGGRAYHTGTVVGDEIVWYDSTCC